MLVTRLKEESPVGLKPRVGREVGKVIFSRLRNFLAPLCAFLTKETSLTLRGCTKLNEPPSGLCAVRTCSTIDGTAVHRKDGSCRRRRGNAIHEYVWRLQRNRCNVLCTCAVIGIRVAAPRTFVSVFARTRIYFRGRVHGMLSGTCKLSARPY